MWILATSKIPSKTAKSLENTCNKCDGALQSVTYFVRSFIS